MKGEYISIETSKIMADIEKENKELHDRIDKAIKLIDLIKPELWNISNKMTYRLIDIENILKGE